LSLRSKFSAAALIVGILLFASCGGVINLPVPAISRLNPPSVPTQAPTFTLAVLGSGFAPSSTVTFNGVPQATIFLSETELTVLVNPNTLVSSGTINIYVTTPPPGGGTSNTVTLVVTQTPLPVPQITSITPNSMAAGSQGGNLTINGSGFVGIPGQSVSIATVDGANRTTTFVSATQLTVALQASDITTVGPVEIAVLNPPATNLTPPGGGVSNAVALNVVNPSPVLKGVNPGDVPAGTTAITSISVTGSGFDSSSQVLVNGTGRTTTFASSTSLSALLATGDVAAAGTYTVQVVNPTPGGGSSQVLYFSVVPAASGLGLPALVDVAPDGAQANDGVSPPSQVGPSMDATGRYVVYTSSSTNVLQTTTLIPPPVTNPLTNGTSNIFLRDTCLGITADCTPRELLVDVGPDEVIANGPSYSPVVNAGTSTSNGADIVAYISLATDLVSGLAFDGTTPQIFATNPCVQATGGCTTTTSPCISSTGNCAVTTNLVSIGSDGLTPGTGPSIEPSISSEGRFIAFASTATNLVTGATTGAQEIYLRDTCFGQPSTCVPTTFLVSVAPDGVTPADGASSEPVVVSGTIGQFVAFTSTATNLVSGSGGAQEIYRVGYCIGITKGCTATSAQLISTPDGTTFADGASVEPAMTPDGRIVAFASTTTVLGAASGGVQEIYERDTCQGAPTGCTPQNVLASVASDGVTPGNALSEDPSLGNGGQYVAFASQASNLVTTNVGGLENVYVRNSCLGQPSTGCTAGTALVSVSATLVPGNGPSLNPVISSSGLIVCFYSPASNLVNNDLNGYPDIFLAFSTF
jgi:trimeric autotransporter adhesin